jgi:hypothetical protein
MKYVTETRYRINKEGKSSHAIDYRGDKFGNK